MVNMPETAIIMELAGLIISLVHFKNEQYQRSRVALRDPTLEHVLHT